MIVPLDREPEVSPQLAEFLSRSWDPLYFSEAMGVKLNPAQERWFRLLVPVMRWQWALKFLIHLAANRTGKTLGVALLILWAANAKIGVDTSDVARWFKAPYRWAHLAPEQQTAYLPLHEITMLVKGAHPAQYDRETGKFRKPLLPEAFVTFAKVENYYDGLTLWNGAQVQFRTTDDRAKALQGREFDGISFDECAYEDNLREVLDSTLSLRVMSTGGPILLVSTPNGINDYFEIVEDVKMAGRHPGLDSNVWVTDDQRGLVKSTVYDNVGFGLTLEEVQRREATLGENRREQALRAEFVSPEKAFFVPAEQITAAFDENLSAPVPPKPGARYVIFWDPSVSSDPSAGYVLDVTSKPWRVVEEMYEQRPRGVAPLVHAMFGVHTERSSATDRQGRRSTAVTGYDATGMGGAMWKDRLRGLNPQKPMDFAGTAKKKLDMLSNLRVALQRRDLVIPASMQGLRRELLNYRLDDQKIVQDRVMALAGAAWLASRGYGGPTQPIAFDPSARVSQSVWR